MMEVPKIAVFPQHEYLRCRSILDALATLYDVDFVEADEASICMHRFAWVLGAAREFGTQVADRGVKVLTFCERKGERISDSAAKVEFGVSDSVPKEFRGCALEDTSLSEVPRLERLPRDEILARKGGTLLWVRNQESTGVLDLVAVSLPELAEGEYLFNYFHGGNWAGLLPVLHYLREVSPWTPPALRACFMFDDPNLHWKTYGHADYRELARHARKHHYHATFATVPLDGWYINRTAASLFQQNKKFLSLLIHGNNHTACELTGTEGSENRRVLAAQAIRRIEKLEEKVGFPVPRVMAAPHGACNHEMAGAMVRSGFDAACISRGSIMGRNPGTTWPVTIGLEVSEFLGDALPVIPRFNIRMDRGSEFSVRLAAFLRQPIIPVGHHDDLGQGLDLLSGLADLINSMGEVRWLDMNAVAESNYCTHVGRNSDMLSIRMFSRRIRLTVPEGVNQIRVVRPWIHDGIRERLKLRTGNAEQRIASDNSETMPVSPGQAIEIASIHPDAFDPANVTSPRTPFRALVRRQLCEIRDRLCPIKDRVLSSISSGDNPK